jgi:hypothetical protein
MILLAFLPGIAAGEKQNFRQAEFGAFTLLTDGSDRAVAAWVAEFDQYRLLVQGLMGIEDEQVLRLTVLLFANKKDFDTLVMPGALQPDRQMLSMIVGLGQQPVLAVRLDSGYKANEAGIRSAMAMWLLSSAGLTYDAWIVQGCMDFFAAMQIRRNEVQQTTQLQQHLRTLHQKTPKNSHPRFALNRGPLEPYYAWAMVHYLVAGRDGWQGLSRLRQYQEKIDRGTERALAFLEVFGCTPAQMEEELAGYLRRGRISAMPVTATPPRIKPDLGLKPVSVGIKDCMMAQFLAQQPSMRADLVKSMLIRAADLVPDDPRLHEAHWMYHRALRDQGQAREALENARRLGSQSAFLRVQWCIDMLNEQILAKGGFVGDETDGGVLADELEALIERNPHGAIAYRILAQVIPSVIPVRERHRRLLEAAVEKAGGEDELFELGLTAWHWRNGELEEAIQRWSVTHRRGFGWPVAQAYSEWLSWQLQATKVLSATREAIKADDLAEAKRWLDRLAPRPLLNPALQLQMQTLRMEFENHRLLALVDKHMTEGRHQAADLLLQSLGDSMSTPQLKEKMEALRARQMAGSPD